MNNYRKLFEQISPSESDEQLISKVLARKEDASPGADIIMKDNNSKKTTKHFLLRKAVIIPTAAALAIGAATISVGAANNWDYSNPFKNMFAANYEGNVNVNSNVHEVDIPTSDPTSGTTSQGTTSKVEKVDYTPERPIGTFDFEKYGKPLDIVLEGDGVTATLNGMLAYDSECLIMYTLTATDEVIAKNGGQVPGLRIDFGNWGFKIDGKRAGGMGYVTDNISEEGNTRTGLIKVHYSSVDLSGKTLNITFLSEALNGTDEVLLKEEKDILVDFPIAENIEKTLDLDLKTDSFDGKINNVKVGGFKAWLNFEGVSNVPLVSAPLGSLFEINSNLGEDWVTIMKDPDFERPKDASDVLYDEIKAFGDAVLNLKDGTTVVAKFDGVGGGERSEDDPTMKGWIRLQYTYPLNPSDVVSITFGEYTIEL